MNPRIVEYMTWAVQAGMKVVGRAQYQGRQARSTEIKSDSTLLTETDRRSGEAMFEVLQEIPDVGIDMEDTGKRECRPGGILLLGDDLDGTRAFATGLATSTCIVAAYDTGEKKLIASVVGEPATGRVWRATEDQPTFEISNVRDVSVWEGSLSRQSSVFLDVSHGFRDVLTDGDVARLFGLLNNQVRIFIPGSNGLIQALVANGGEGLAGGISTAKGGPWDMAGIYLVIRAGGAARAFSLGADRILSEKNPLDPTSFDLAVYGNSEETVDALVEVLGEALQGKIADHLIPKEEGGQA